MANIQSLISPGISVTVTDQSYYIPATATTVPLIFIATAEGKLLSDGTQAAGTLESNVVETLTSISQSQTLYGVPNFFKDSAGNPQHGDARNEYGLLALNQALSSLSLAYVVRAEVDLDDSITNILTNFNSLVHTASTALNTLVSSFITNYNNANGYIPSNPLYATSVNITEFLSLAHQALSVVYERYAFSNISTNFEGDLSAPANQLPIYENGYNFAPTGAFIGLAGIANAWVTNGSGGSSNPTGWTPTQAAATLTLAAQGYSFTTDFLNKTSLGANDAARRVTIVTALNAVINNNQDVRSEFYEYNLVLCPGYPEAVPSLTSLVADINHEAFVIGDIPFTTTPATAVTSFANTAIRSYDVAYYYPPLSLTTNLDGQVVAGATSGVVLAVFAYSDAQAYVWEAPAGVNRGLISDAVNVTSVGYVTGTLGAATTWVDVKLNQGQRDNLYGTPAFINPIINSPGTGLAVFGQRTFIPGNLATSRDRVNVARMICFVKRQIRKNLLPFLFEPNDQITRNNVKSSVDSFLSNIMHKRGLADFATICDTSNNPADVVQQNQLYINIALKPMLAVEFIYVPIVLTTQGANLNTVLQAGG